jgi:hypothetical protein
MSLRNGLDRASLDGGLAAVEDADAVPEGEGSAASVPDMESDDGAVDDDVDLWPVPSGWLLVLGDALDRAVFLGPADRPENLGQSAAYVVMLEAAEPFVVDVDALALHRLKEFAHLLFGQASFLGHFASCLPGVDVPRNAISREGEGWCRSGIKGGLLLHPVLVGCAGGGGEDGGDDQSEYHLALGGLLAGEGCLLHLLGELDQGVACGCDRGLHVGVVEQLVAEFGDGAAVLGCHE